MTSKFEHHFVGNCLACPFILIISQLAKWTCLGLFFPFSFLLIRTDCLYSFSRVDENDFLVQLCRSTGKLLKVRPSFVFVFLFWWSSICWYIISLDWTPYTTNFIYPNSMLVLDHGNLEQGQCFCSSLHCPTHPPKSYMKIVHISLASPFFPTLTQIQARVVH